MHMGGCYMHEGSGLWEGVPGMRGVGYGRVFHA